MWKCLFFKSKWILQQFEARVESLDHEEKVFPKIKHIMVKMYSPHWNLMHNVSTPQQNDDFSYCGHCCRENRNKMLFSLRKGDEGRDNLELFLQGKWGSRVAEKCPIVTFQRFERTVSGCMLLRGKISCLSGPELRN